MSTMFSWRVVTPAPGEPVAPDERLPWGKTVGLGAQHVVAMFGATFVFPLVMGLDPNLAIMFSMSETSSLRSMDLGCRTCFRLKASN